MKLGPDGGTDVYCCCCCCFVINCLNLWCAAPQSTLASCVASIMNSGLTADLPTDSRSKFMKSARLCCEISALSSDLSSLDAPILDACQPLPHRPIHRSWLTFLISLWAWLIACATSAPNLRCVVASNTLYTLTSATSLNLLSSCCCRSRTFVERLWTAAAALGNKTECHFSGGSGR